MKRKRLLWGALLGLAFGWFLFVWPTPWVYFKSGSENLRVNRFDGQTEILTRWGWARMAAPITNPFADLPNAK
jgi:hypothetical protein